MQQVNVELGSRGYPVQVGAGLLARNAALLTLAQGRSVAVVTDKSVDRLFGDVLAAGLKGVAHRLVRIVLPPGEGTKSWESLNRIVDTLLESRFDRNSLIVALGGGVIGDLAGFAAATYQRGIDFVQVPTTLLAQVDSSVGGKTAINHPRGKNMIGAFHQPRLVIADTETLASLPPRELSAGLAEVIKHGAIADADYLDRVASRMPQLLAHDASALADAVVASIRIKAEVVARDERESGARALLNFGHTFGHAIEAGAGYGKWLHGEAVGVGMVMATDLSMRLGYLGEHEVARMKAVIGDAGLPLQGPAWPLERYLAYMSIDKKAAHGVPKFVVLRRVGEAAVQKVEQELVAQAIAAHTVAAVA
jgi:3-dehydroquinate synthase